MKITEEDIVLVNLHSCVLFCKYLFYDFSDLLLLTSKLTQDSIKEDLLLN